MTRPVLPIFSLFVFLTGCVDSATTPLVPQDPFGSVATPPPVRQTSLSPPTSNVESAARVDRLGRQILLANPAISVKPLFRTVGAPHIEVFHQGSDIYITDGLVNRCPQDGQLAAVLCTELGKMVAEREAVASPKSRSAFREPPMETRVGNDNAGSFGPADLTRQAELAKYERERRQAKVSPGCPAPLPDPQALARAYLTKSGFAAAELDSVAPLLKSAAAGGVLEKQIANPIPTPTSTTWHR